MRLLARRVAALVPVLVIVGIVTFAIIHLTPGNPAAVMLGEGATPQQVAQLSHQLGLDRPLVEQFFTWAGNALRGNLGQSIFYQQPVLDVIGQNLLPTVYLAIFSTILSLLLSWPAGVLAGRLHRSWPDKVFMSVSMIGNSIPGFWLGLMLILAFAVGLRWFPVTGYVQPAQGAGQWIWHLVLPVVVLSVNQAPIIARMLRDGVAENLGRPYIRTARAKGGSEPAVLLGHAVPNALIPTLTVIGTSLATLLSGAVVVEVVFNIPGLGNLIYTAIENRDYPLVEGTALIFALLYVGVNFLVDLLYLVVDPRIRAR